MATGLFLQAVGLAWVALVASQGADYASFVVPLVTAGVGISMALPTVPAAALSAVAPPDMGKASGVTNTVQRLGGVFAVALVTAVLGAHVHLENPAQISTAVGPALVVSAAISLLGAMFALAVSARTGRPQSEAAASPVSA
jgi:hypothetical protein